MKKINFINNQAPALNGANLNKLQDNVEEAITENTNAIAETDNKHNYSTEEQVIGTWIDDKPIYRKVITKTCDAGTTISIAHNINNLNEITSLQYFTFNNGNKNTDIPLNSSNSFRINRISNTTISGTISNAYDSGWQLKITLEYTKTTDEV